LFALRLHPEFPLVLAANRDEFFERPTVPAAPWPGVAGIVAGRDGVGGGTWLGVSARARLAVLTNYRDLRAVPPGAPSRGQLVVDYLEQGEPERYLRALHVRAAGYAGFSLLVGTSHELWHYSNREGRAQRCEDGVHGLSNHLLDTPWPKVTRGRERLAEILAAADVTAAATRDERRRALVQRLLAALDDMSLAPDDALPNTGLSLERERALSSIRIVTPGYGTRSSSVVLTDCDGNLHFTERTLPVGDQVAADRSFTIVAGSTVRSGD
jgi:uncharacterized protein with NRDE domain